MAKITRYRRLFKDHKTLLQLGDLLKVLSIIILLQTIKLLVQCFGQNIPIHPCVLGLTTSPPLLKILKNRPTACKINFITSEALINTVNNDMTHMIGTMTKQFCQFIDYFFVHHNL